MFFQKSFKLCFVVTQLFFTVFAVKTSICLGRKAFGMSAICDLPSDKQKNSASEKAVGIESRYKNERREHHREVPIVYSAGGTASVFHEPRLERAEKQNTYKVTH